MLDYENKACIKIMKRIDSHVTLLIKEWVQKCDFTFEEHLGRKNNKQVG